MPCLNYNGVHICYSTFTRRRLPRSEWRPIQAAEQFPDFTPCKRCRRFLPTRGVAVALMVPDGKYYGPDPLMAVRCRSCGLLQRHAVGDFYLD